MKRTVSFVAAVILIFCLSITVFADMGSKPRAEIILTNAPDCEYYIDLLYVPADPENVHSNMDDGVKYNADIISILSSYEEDGWYTAYCHGTGAPMWGNIVPDEENRVVFSYFGVPASFRVVVADENGNIRTSDVIERNSMEVSVTIDYSNMSYATKPLWQAYRGQFLFTFSITVIVELIIMMLFKISLKENFKTFLCTNLLTQTIFTAAYSSAFIYGGTIGCLTAFFPLEAAVTISETLIYRKRFKCNSLSVSTLYAITANLTTALLTWVNIDKLTDFMFSLIR